MTVRVLGALSILMVLAGATASQTAAQEQLNIQVDMSQRIITWDDRPDEAAYHVTGTIQYLHFPACGTSERAYGEKVNIDQELPANTTSFRLPPPNDLRADSVKDYQIRIDALGSADEVLASGGRALTADQFCTPEEIAAGLAAAGTGPDAANSPVGRSWLIALFGLGVLGTAGVAIMRRMTR